MFLWLINWRLQPASSLWLNMRWLDISDDIVLMNKKEVIPQSRVPHPSTAEWQRLELRTTKAHGELCKGTARPLPLKDRMDAVDGNCPCHDHATLVSPAEKNPCVNRVSPI